MKYPIAYFSCIIISIKSEVCVTLMCFLVQDCARGHTNLLKNVRHCDPVGRENAAEVAEGEGSGQIHVLHRPQYTVLSQLFMAKQSALDKI